MAPALLRRSDRFSVVDVAALLPALQQHISRPQLSQLQQQPLQALAASALLTTRVDWCRHRDQRRQAQAH